MTEAQETVNRMYWLCNRRLWKIYFNLPEIKTNKIVFLLSFFSDKNLNQIDKIKTPDNDYLCFLRKQNHTSVGNKRIINGLILHENPVPEEIIVVVISVSGQDIAS